MKMSSHVSHKVKYRWKIKGTFKKAEIALHFNQVPNLPHQKQMHYTPLCQSALFAYDGETDMSSHSFSKDRRT